MSTTWTSSAPASPAAARAAPREVRVELRRGDGKVEIALDGEACPSHAELTRRLRAAAAKGGPVRVRVLKDEDVPMRAVMGVMDACRRAGVKDVVAEGAGDGAGLPPPRLPAAKPGGAPPPAAIVRLVPASGTAKPGAPLRVRAEVRAFGRVARGGRVELALSTPAGVSLKAGAARSAVKLKADGTGASEFEVVVPDEKPYTLRVTAIAYYKGSEMSRSTAELSIGGGRAGALAKPGSGALREGRNADGARVIEYPSGRR